MLPRICGTRIEAPSCLRRSSTCGCISDRQAHNAGFCQPSKAEEQLAMQLYIVRHGIAIDREDPKSPPDPERFLTEEGIEKTKEVARGVVRLGIVPDLLISSPYVRAMQTAEIFAAAFKYP